MLQPDARIDLAFKALGDPTRLAVVEALARGPASVGDLARPFDMALPSFLQHLRLLEQSGLVVTEKAGRVRTCRLNETALAQAGSWLDRQRSRWTERLDRLDALALSLKDREDKP